MEDGGAEDGGDGYEHYTHGSPTLHLPHLLRMLGPFSLTLYDHDQMTKGLGMSTTPQFKGKQKEGINVLTIVTLHNIDTLKQESRTSHSWIACTIDAMFLEKLALRPGHRLNFLHTLCCATMCPGLQPVIKEPYARRLTYRLSTSCFTWSDVKLWTKLDCILQLDADLNGVVHASRIVPSLGVGGHLSISSNNGSSGLFDQWSLAVSQRKWTMHRRPDGDGIEGRQTSYCLPDDRGNTTTSPLALAWTLIRASNSNASTDPAAARGNACHPNAGVRREPVVGH
ncbi:hypothetical protein EDB87DRAFT_1692384 [Lactarius vividus]|nr:hypothetical protein EDB87DRAFT_1692384 [Lactarius vividus]